MSLASNDPTLGKVKIGNGLVGSSAEQEIVEGSSVQIHAIAESGASFQKWYDGNTNATRTVTVTEDMEFTAIFVEDEPDAEPEYVTLILKTMAHGRGAMRIGDGEYGTHVEEDVVAGSSVVISAQGQGMYKFARWSDDNTEATRTIVVNEDTTLQAIFVQDDSYEEPQQETTFKLSLTSDDPSLGKVKIGNGLVGSSAEQEIVEGNSVQIHAIAESGGRFVSWSDGNTEETRTVTVTDDMEFQAHFAQMF